LVNDPPISMLSSVSVYTPPALLTLLATAVRTAPPLLSRIVTAGALKNTSKLIPAPDSAVSEKTSWVAAPRVALLARNAPEAGVPLVAELNV
jgi:hypothetical protein